MAYDVSTETAAGRRRLRRVAQVCKAFGQRVQKSVFECEVNEMRLAQLEHRLLKCINLEEDSLRIYRLREPRDQYVRVYGVRRELDLREALMV